MTKSEIVRAVSQHSGFALEDTKIFIDSFCDVMKDTLERGEPFLLNGYFKGELRYMKPRERAWDGINKKWIPREGRYRVVLSTMRHLENIGKNDS